MIFLAQNNVVDKNAGEDDIVLQRIDTVSGSLAADVIARLYYHHDRHGVVPGGYSD